MLATDGSHQTAAQRGGEAKDKDRPLSDLQRDRCSITRCHNKHLFLFHYRYVASLGAYHDMQQAATFVHAVLA